MDKPQIGVLVLNNQLTPLFSCNTQVSQKAIYSIGLDVKDFTKEMKMLHEQRDEMLDLFQRQSKIFLNKGKIKETYHKDDMLLEKGSVSHFQHNSNV